MNLFQLPCLNVELPQLVFEMVLEKYVVNLAVLAHGIEVDLKKRREPFVVKFSETLAARRRSGDWIRALQAASVDGVAFNCGAHLTD